ncbi:Protein CHLORORESPIRATORY REDUCTION 42-like [Dillenia turbinata]|uniref:Protein CHLORORESPIRATORY REDUCTION 42-like n=1 Tax=Dillenia turbinata TaxID=194707 RepID=A0AAN8V819_9MAGN
MGPYGAGREDIVLINFKLVNYTDRRLQRLGEGVVHSSLVVLQSGSFKKWHEAGDRVSNYCCHEASQMVKTAAAVHCLRIKSSLVKPGDVGIIVSRKPKDVRAVRLTDGTYFLVGIYVKPLELDDH